MGEYSEAFVAFDMSKMKHAVAIADGGFSARCRTLRQRWFAPVRRRPMIGRRKRQQLLSFLLRHGRIYSDGGHWTLAHRRWLAKQAFEHPAQQIVFQEAIDAIGREAAA